MERARISRRLSVVQAPEPVRALARSTVLVMAVTLVSTVLGFAREVVTARYYGASWELDAYLAALVVPTILFGVFNGALVSALVPIFSDYVALEQRDEASRLASTLITVVGGLLVVAAAGGWILAPYYMPLFVHFAHSQLALTVEITRLLVPSIVATSLSGIMAAVLNANRRFAAAALQGVVINVAVIGCVLAGASRYGIAALSYGTVAGFIAQVVVQTPAFLALLGGRWRVDVHHPALRRVLAALGPIALGSAAGQIAMFFDRFFASGLGAGSISGMNYAIKIVGFPQQLFVTAIATVIFPLFSSHVSLQNARALRRSIVTSLQLVIFLTIPSSLGIAMLAGPIVQTLFERGAFTPQATVLCASLLPFCAAGLVALAANVILTRCLFAGGRIRESVAISIGSVAVNVVFSIVFLPSLGARGLLLANSVSQTLQMVALAIVVWRSIGGFDFGRLVRSTTKVAGISLVMVGALSAVQLFEAPVADAEIFRIVSLAEHLGFGAAVFVALARFFDAEELRLAVDLLVRRKRPPELTPLA